MLLIQLKNETWRCYNIQPSIVFLIEFVKAVKRNFLGWVIIIVLTKLIKGPDFKGDLD